MVALRQQGAIAQPSQLKQGQEFRPPEDRVRAGEARRCGQGQEAQEKRPSAVDIPFSRAITGGTGGRLRKARGMATQTYVGTNATGVPNATFRLKVVVGAAGGS